MILSIDIETYSSKNLKKTGLYPYVHDPDFQVLMIAYAYDDNPVQIVDLTEYGFPAWLRADILNPAIRKSAYNAPFEIGGLSREFGIDLNPADWDCTLVQGARAGYPVGLDAIANALQVPGKFESGTALINYFTQPCKPTKSNGRRTRNYSYHDPEKWAEFMAYCENDVQVERAVRNKVKDFPVIPQEHALWQLDQRINDRGVLVDIPYVTKVVEIAEWYTALIRAEAIELTGVQNPNSRNQLIEWLNENLDEDEEEVTKLTKATVEEMLSYMPEGKVRRLLELRQEMSKSSLRKYDAMLNMAGYDGRIRGLFQFYGASRTGRWAGRGVQLQNLPRNYIELLDLARRLAESGDGEGIDTIFGNVPDVLSQLVRTALIPKPGFTFLVSDFSAIEARVIAWLAGETWKLEVFATHGKIYEAAASRMFNVPIELIAKGKAHYDLRAKGKVAELALGYGGTTQATINMGALKGGLTEDDLWPIVNAWRRTNPMIVKLWDTVEKAARLAIMSPGKRVTIQKGISFRMHGGDLWVQLPSGRILAYVDCRIVSGARGRSRITYRKAEKKAWLWADTYGGKLVENIVQAIARDCLAVALMRLERAGFNIVMHVHDEAVAEEKLNTRTLQEMNAIMSETIPWASDLLLSAEGFETSFYKKD